MEYAGPDQHFALDTPNGRVTIARTIMQRRDVITKQVIWQGTENISVSAGEWMTESMAAELIRWLANNCRGDRPAWIGAGEPTKDDNPSHLHT